MITYHLLIEEARDQNNFLVESEVDARPQHSVHCSPAQGRYVIGSIRCVNIKLEQKPAHSVPL